MISLSDSIPAGAILVCAAMPIGLIVIVALLASRARTELRLSANGIEQRGVNGFGLPRADAWPAPVAVHIAPLWNFDVTGAISGFDQYQVAFMQHPDVPIEELMLDPETTHMLVAAVRRLNTPAIVLNVRSLMPVKPSTLCPCGYDLIGIAARVCPECGAGIDVNRFEVLQRMHAELQAAKAANQTQSETFQESHKEQP